MKNIFEKDNETIKNVQKVFGMTREQCKRDIIIHTYERKPEDVLIEETYRETKGVITSGRKFVKSIIVDNEGSKLSKSDSITFNYIDDHISSNDKNEITYENTYYDYTTKYENHNVELLDTLLLVLYEEYTIEGFNYVVDAFNLI